MKPVRFVRSARKHRIGRAHVAFVILHVQATTVPAASGRDARVVWIGADDRGVELEVVALDQPEELVVIHVMPTAYRRKT